MDSPSIHYPCGRCRPRGSRRRCQWRTVMLNLRRFSLLYMSPKAQVSGGVCQVGRFVEWNPFGRACCRKISFDRDLFGIRRRWRPITKSLLHAIFGCFLIPALGARVANEDGRENASLGNQQGRHSGDLQSGPPARHSRPNIRSLRKMRIKNG